MKYKKVVITPDMAKNILKGSFGYYRYFSQRNVERLMSMLELKIQPEEQLMFYEEKLFDGQDILAAVIKAGIPTTCVIRQINPRKEQT